MVLGYTVSPHFDDSFMLGDETFRPKSWQPYYDWRFGREGRPHPATCGTCGRKIDPDYVNPEFRMKKRKWDIASTYDGEFIVSERFRRFCLDHDPSGLDFLVLTSDPGRYVFHPRNVLAFDSERRGTRFESWCPECQAFFSVIGADPVCLRDVTGPIQKGFFRTDLDFASGHEQHPLVIVGIETADEMRCKGFRRPNLQPIRS